MAFFSNLFSFPVSVLVPCPMVLSFRTPFQTSKQIFWMYLKHSRRNVFIRILFTQHDLHADTNQLAPEERARRSLGLDHPATSSSSRELAQEIVVQDESTTDGAFEEADITDGSLSETLLPSHIPDDISPEAVPSDSNYIPDTSMLLTIDSDFDHFLKETATFASAKSSSKQSRHRPGTLVIVSDDDQDDDNDDNTSISLTSIQDDGDNNSTSTIQEDTTLTASQNPNLLLHHSGVLVLLPELPLIHNITGPECRPAQVSPDAAKLAAPPYSSPSTLTCQSLDHVDVNPTATEASNTEVSPSIEFTSEIRISQPTHQPPVRVTDFNTSDSLSSHSAVDDTTAGSPATAAIVASNTNAHDMHGSGISRTSSRVAGTVAHV
jgi:hypothetical protein